MIDRIADYAEFEQFMPKMYKGMHYVCDGQYDRCEKQFTPKYFQFCDSNYAEVIEEIPFPQDLIPCAIKVCEAIDARWRENEDEDCYEEQYYPHEDRDYDHWRDEQDGR